MTNLSSEADLLPALLELTHLSGEELVQVKVKCAHNLLKSNTDNCNSNITTTIKPVRVTKKTKPSTSSYAKAHRPKRPVVGRSPQAREVVPVFPTPEEDQHDDHDHLHHHHHEHDHNHNHHQHHQHHEQGCCFDAETSSAADQQEAQQHQQEQEQLVPPRRPPKAITLVWSSPDQLALAIALEKLDFAQLFSVRRVCRKWKTVAEALLARRPSIKLFDWAPTRAANDELFLSPFNRKRGMAAALAAEPIKAATFLGRLLPNVVSVHAPCADKWQAQLLLTLLGRWGGALEQLTISGLPKNKALEGKLLNGVLRQNNRMPRLRSLSLYGLSEGGRGAGASGPATTAPVQLPKRSPLLGQLETFSLEGYTGDLTPLLLQLGPPIRNLLVNAEHERVNLDTQQLEAFLISGGSGGSSKVGDRLKFLDLALIPDDPRRLWRIICTHFPHLEKLRASFLCGVSFTDTLPLLGGLPRLEKLYFNVDLKKGPYPGLERVAPLKQVRILFLGAVADPAFDIATFRATIGRLFPDLEELRMATFSPNAVEVLAAVIKRIFPRLKSHQIGLANRSKMEVGVRRTTY